MKIESLRIDLRDLELQDVFDMRSWGRHENPLLDDYNFPDINDGEIKIWYKMKTKKKSDRYFSIRDKSGTLIGYMGIKRIKRIRKTSTLGIVLDPDMVDKGYGREVIEAFLEYYFEDMGMRSMELEVSAFNRRAYHLYKKIGFEKTWVYKEKFINQFINRENPYFKEAESYFEIKDEKIYNYIYIMKIDRNRFFQLRQEHI